MERLKPFYNYQKRDTIGMTPRSGRKWGKNPYQEERCKHKGEQCFTNIGSILTKILIQLKIKR